MGVSPKPEQSPGWRGQELRTHANKSDRERCSSLPRKGRKEHALARRPFAPDVPIPPIKSGKLQRRSGNAGLDAASGTLSS